MARRRKGLGATSETHLNRAESAATEAAALVERAAVAKGSHRESACMRRVELLTKAREVIGRARAHIDSITREGPDPREVRVKNDIDKADNRVAKAFDQTLTKCGFDP